MGTQTGILVILKAALCTFNLDAILHKFKVKDRLWEFVSKLKISTQENARLSLIPDEWIKHQAHGPHSSSHI